MTFKRGGQSRIGGSKAVPRRFGGEEFAMILPETTPVDGLLKLDRIRSLVEQSEITRAASGKAVRLTFSAGLADHRADAESSDTLLAAADLRLFAAKGRGRCSVIGVEHVIPT